MCCFNNNCCCRPCCPDERQNITNSFNRIIFRTIIVPAIPNSVASFNAATVTGALLVLTPGTSSPVGQRDIVLNPGTNTVNLTAGTYSIAYGSNTTSTDATIPTLTLSLNGIEQPLSVRTGTADGSSNIAGNYVITVPAGSTLGLVNEVSASTTYANNYLNIQKVG